MTCDPEREHRSLIVTLISALLHYIFLFPFFVIVSTFVRVSFQISQLMNSIVKQFTLIFIFDIQVLA